jgi:hypothetical protein
MDSKTVELLDEKITDIRIELMKGKEVRFVDKMLYNLQISVYKLEDK